VGVVEEQDGVALRAQGTPLCEVGRKPLLHMRVNSACAETFGENRGVSTTKAGRSLFSLPEPVLSQDPMLALPGISLPVMRKVQAGSWLMALVCTLRTIARSSTTLAVQGRRSLTHAPLWPCWAKLKTDGATGNRVCPLVMVVMRWPWRMDSGRSTSKCPLKPGL
jgi:hypothetical protein